MPTERYASDVSFPAYAFVPGRHPHPVTDPRGHSYGQSHLLPVPLDPNRAASSREFLYGLDLFNAGFYWEAHEAWEELWIVAGRSGTVANFLKGLIKLAAAGVKSREGQPMGVQRHARRAAELFQLVSATLTGDQDRFAGLNIEELIQNSDSLAEQPIIDETPSMTGRPVIPFSLKFD